MVSAPTHREVFIGIRESVPIVNYLCTSQEGEGWTFNASDFGTITTPVKPTWSNKVSKALGSTHHAKKGKLFRNNA